MSQSLINYVQFVKQKSFLKQKKHQFNKLELIHKQINFDFLRDTSKSTYSMFVYILVIVVIVVIVIREMLL